MLLVNGKEEGIKEKKEYINKCKQLQYEESQKCLVLVANWLLLIIFLFLCIDCRNVPAIIFISRDDVPLVSEGVRMDSGVWTQSGHPNGTTAQDREKY